MISKCLNLLRIQPQGNPKAANLADGQLNLALEGIGVGIAQNAQGLEKMFPQHHIHRGCSFVHSVHYSTP